MSLHPQAIEAIPEDTLRVARAAFPKGKNPIMVLRDHLSTLFSDQDFLALYSALGQPAYPPYRLMLVSVFQFMENLTDRQAANAVRARIDCLEQNGTCRACSLEIRIRFESDRFWFCGMAREVPLIPRRCLSPD